MVNPVCCITLALACAGSAIAFATSLGGVSREELDETSSLQYHPPAAPPGPLKFNGTKLVNDKAHPWQALKHGDMRGPCPGLNTLASHGYLPRNGIATPAQIINAVQEGFNMENTLARSLTYAAHLSDGNLLADELSIGGKSPLTGPNPPAPATVAGLNTHATFEGDASMTRADAFFGDNHSFNETLFDQFTAFSKQFGGGRYNLTVAGEYQFHRIQDSIATNPHFSFVSLRYITTYMKSVFPINMFVDGRQADFQLDIDVARSFFRDMRMPNDFHRANQPIGAKNMDLVAAAHPVPPGANINGVNTYNPDPNSADLSPAGFCLLYTNFVNQTVRSLYPNPTGNLRKALIKNLDFFYDPFGIGGCSQVFPYGRDN